MRKVFLHVGMQKTGSTWLQQIIFPQIESVDIIYKDSFRESMYKWKDRNLLVSYENYVGYPHYVDERGLNGFVRTRECAIRNLSKIFPSANIIIVLREQVSFINSLYNQYIKVGGSISFDEYINGAGVYALEKEALVYTDFLKSLRSSFSGKILVIDFSLFKRDKKQFGLLISDFLEVKEKIDFEYSGQSSVNKSLNRKQITRLRKFNNIFQNKYSPDGVRLPRPAFKAARKLLVFCSKNCNEKEVMSRCDSDRLTNYYAKGWAEIQSLSGEKGYFLY